MWYNIILNQTRDAAMSTQTQKSNQEAPTYDKDGNTNYLWKDQQNDKQPTQPLYDGDGNTNYLYKQ
jgi:hypothetical protein